MNKFVYFMAVGLAFTALQVTTVEAMHDQAHVDEVRATEDSARQTMRETEDRTRQTARDAEDTARQTRRDAEDTARQAAQEAMNAAAGGTDGGQEGCMHHPAGPARVACEAGEGGHHDCSEIPDAAGRALCETAEARGTPPTAAECALVGDPAECLRHAAGGGDGGPDCEAMGASGSAARTACEARGNTGGGHEDCIHHPAGPARAACEAGN